MEAKRILFVCLGNICRSPAAETIFKKLASEKGIPVIVDSAGTSAWHEGEKADYRMRCYAKERGYTITSVSRKVTLSDFDDFDMIVAMDENNYFDLCLLTLDPEKRKKIFRMSKFIRKSGYSEIPDPYYGGYEGFKLVVDLLEDGSKKIIEFLKKGERTIFF